MRFDKFTLKVQEALQEAQTLAGSLGHQAIDVEHLLLSLSVNRTVLLAKYSKTGGSAGRAGTVIKPCP